MKITKHLLFWICITSLLTIIFGRSHDNIIESFYFVSLLLPVVVMTAYFFNYFLVVKYLFTQKYYLFALYSIYLLIISLNLEMLVITLAYIVIAEYDYNNMNPVTADVSVLTITLYFIVLIFSFIRLIRHYLRHQSEIIQYKAEIEKSTLQSINIKENRKNRVVALNQVRYIESLGDYVKIHLGEENITTKEKISSLEKRLPTQFIRIHRSFLVNKLYVSSYNKDQLQINEQQLPISRTFKQNVILSLS